LWRRGPRPRHFPHLSTSFSPVSPSPQTTRRRAFCISIRGPELTAILYLAFTSPLPRLYLAFTSPLPRLYLDTTGTSLSLANYVIYASATVIKQRLPTSCNIRISKITCNLCNFGQTIILFYSQVYLILQSCKQLRTQLYTFRLQFEQTQILILHSRLKSFAFLFKQDYFIIRKYSFLSRSQYVHYRNIYFSSYIIFNIYKCTCVAVYFNTRHIINDISL
jgi:hypothetical protein